METSLRVQILGRELALRVQEENAEHTRALAERVDKRMRAFQNQHPKQAKLTTALITALALAEELDLERRGRAGQEEDLRALTQTLAGALDEEAP